MQLLYGRDKTDYKVLSKSKEMSDSVATVLIDNYLGYDFVKNKSEYSNVSKEPFSISYCTTNLDGYLNNEMILVSKNGINENYTTPSKYAHARLFEIESGSFKESFFDIFKYSFVDSQDSEKYKADDIDSYIGQMTELKNTQLLSEKALKSILYLLFDNFRDISNTVYIISDNVGDSYNERSIDIIKQVYKYIPYFMRKIIGFMSYGTINQKYSNRIKLVVMTRESSEIESELKVDLLNLDLQKIEKITTDQSKLVVDYILSIDDLERKELFEVIDFENKKSILTIKNLFNICTTKKLWIDSSDFNKMSSWIYNVINPNELEEDLFYKMMDIIEKDLDSEKFNSYLKQILAKESNICEGYLDKDKDLYNLLLFEDILSVDYKQDYNIKIDIDVEYIIKWWNEKIFSMLKQKSEAIDFCKVLKVEKEKYETLDLQGDSYLKLKNAMIENLDKLLLQEEKLTEKFVEEERYNLNLKLENIKSIKGLNDLAKEIDSSEVKYDKNKEILKIEYGKKFKEIADNEYNSFKQLERFIEIYKEYMSQDSIDYLQYLKNKELDEFKNKVNNCSEISKLERLVSESDMNYEKEITILNKFEKIIKSMNIDSMNNDNNIYYGLKICENIKFIKNIVNNPLVSILVNRDLDLNLYDIETILKNINKKIDFIESNKKYLAFDVNNYNLNIRINNEKNIYIIKFGYLNDLLEYIKSKQKKSKLSISKFINNSFNLEKKAFIKDNRELLNLIDKNLKK